MTWWLEDRLLDQTFIATSENVVQNVLVIGQLERRHLHANLRCRASNAAAITGFNNSLTSQSHQVLRHHQLQTQQQQQQNYQLHTLVTSVQLDLNCKCQWHIIIALKLFLNSPPSRISLPACYPRALSFKSPSNVRQRSILCEKSFSCFSQRFKEK